MLKRISLFIFFVAAMALGYFLAVAGDQLGGGRPAAGPASGGWGGRSGGAGYAGRGGDGPIPGAGEGRQVPVEVSAVWMSTLRDRVSGSGILEPVREVSIVSRVEGEVEALEVEEGDRVAEGQALCAIDERALQIAVKVAKAELDQAISSFQRLEDLLGRKAVSPQEVDDARYARDRAEAAHDEALLRLTYSHPMAPFEGIVVERGVEKGQHVRLNDELFRLADVDPLLLRVHLPDRAVDRVEVDQPVELRTDRDAPPEALGRVERISPVVDRESLTVEVTLRFDGVSPRLRPGTFGRADIVTRTIDQAILVPRRAVRRDNGSPYVYRVVDGERVQKLEVTIGYEDEEVIQIASGLEVGDSVVVEGFRDLQDGSAVRIFRQVPVPEGGTTPPRAGG